MTKKRTTKGLNATTKMLLKPARQKSNKGCAGTINQVVIGLVVFFGIIVWANSNKQDTSTAPIPTSEITEIVTDSTQAETPSQSLFQNTNTPLANTQIAPTATPNGIIAYQDQTIYIPNTARLRSCPQTSCDELTNLIGGSLQSDYSIEGEAVNAGNNAWYHTTYDNQDAYVYSGIVQLTAPVITQSQTTGVQAQSAPPPEQQSWNCSGDLYNCTDFSNRAQMLSYFNFCPGDPSRLDSNNDGVPCESLR